SPLNILSDLMISKMMLGEKERDMVIMEHNFIAEYPNKTKELIRARMLEFGIPGQDTAIARTVALPAAIAADMILNNKIKVKGVHIPILPEIYNPILDELEKLGISMQEEYGLSIKEKIVI
nr:hypothetical protein [Bacteroidales bacterium]